jgi:hypothetical protein
MGGGRVCCYSTLFSSPLTPPVERGRNQHLTCFSCGTIGVRDSSGDLRSHGCGFESYMAHQKPFTNVARFFRCSGGILRSVSSPLQGLWRLYRAVLLRERPLSRDTTNSVPNGAISVKIDRPFAARLEIGVQDLSLSLRCATLSPVDWRGLHRSRPLG